MAGQAVAGLECEGFYFCDVVGDDEGCEFGAVDEEVFGVVDGS